MREICSFDVDDGDGEESLQRACVGMNVAWRGDTILEREFIQRELEIIYIVEEEIEEEIEEEEEGAGIFCSSNDGSLASTE